MRNPFVIVVFVVFGANQCFCDLDNSAVQLRAKQMSILDEILKQDRYDPRVRPAAANESDGPTRVEVDAFLHRIPSVSDVNMEMDVLITLSQKWHDARLIFSDLDGKIKHLTLSDAERIWRPDTFVNDKRGQLVNSISPQFNIRIFPDGSVVYSVRASLTLLCPMDFRRYPFDTQSCPLSISSYGHSKEDVVFQWRDENAVQAASDLQMSQFRLAKFQSVDCAEERSCLTIDLRIRRDFPHFLVQIYIPCSMLIIVSWLTFWLDNSAVSTRVFLSVAILLTMTIQVANFNSKVPPTPYTKAIDLWTGMCLTFVFNTLIVVVLVNYVTRRSNRRAKKGRHDDGMEMANAAVASLVPDDPPVDDEDKAENPRRNHGDSLFRRITVLCGLGWLVRRYPSPAKRIDVVSRVMFPLMFLTFLALYYLTHGPDN